jgi:membrane protein YdbS with pleckstrin-like domain
MDNKTDQKIMYPGQPQDEITQRVVYKHIISIFPFLFSVFVMGVVGILGAYYLGANSAQVSQYVPQSLVSLGGFLYILILIFLFVGVLWIWRRNKIVITNQHIVDIDQVGIFNRTVSTLRLGEIQDLSADVHGPMQTIFQYGTIMIQTAGERENFKFDYVPHPYELEHYILEIRQNFHGEYEPGSLTQDPIANPTELTQPPH